MTSGERLRLFVAVDVPTDHLARVQELTAPLRAELGGARWTSESNQHITVKFLGSTPSERLAEVAEVCADVAARHASAEVHLNGLGAFPSLRRARVLWMGIDDPDGVLQRVAGALDRGFEALGYAREPRVYTPHLTLARMKSPAPIRGPLPVMPTQLSPFSIDHLTLYRSRLSPRGAVYEVLERFALA
ncbi:MAG: RNA 2',3'-cyclic phosphodiesterase [Actinomycetota bacterium]|nr:RNA 2',3'-cyclic phosphodiesterase [Actinomycetota bacterium]